MKRVARYLGVGAAAAAVDIALFAVFARYLGYPYLAVGFCTFIVATAVNYALSIRFVFQSGIRFARRHEIVLVFAVSAVGLAVNQVMLYVGVEFLHMDRVLAKVLATASVFVWNYFARSRFVFRGSP